MVVFERLTKRLLEFKGIDWHFDDSVTLLILYRSIAQYDTGIGVEVFLVDPPVDLIPGNTSDLQLSWQVR